MSRTIGNWARQCVLRAKQIPALRRLLKAPLAAPLLATAAKWFPPADPHYENWIAARLHKRRDKYAHATEPGLLSLITPVWNTPPEYLCALATSVLQQSGDQPFEWVVLDNGTTRPETLEVLRDVLARDPRVRLFRSETNQGIVAGMRFCLEQATGRYVVAVDHDDRLDADCLKIVTHYIQRHDYPPLLFSDEDHICGQNRLLPYFKPDWDPVLFHNSAYTAHLGVMDRRLALELDVYGDSDTNSCPDWDAFLRFSMAGHVPVHIPEILYSWRMHAGSTSANMHSKNDVSASHRAMLTRYLHSRGDADHHEIIHSPLFSGTPDWWIRRRHVDPRPLLLVVTTADQHRPPALSAAITGDYPCEETIAIPRAADPAILQDRIANVAAANGLVAFVDDTLTIDGDEWAWEVLGLIERHPDICMVGGRILDRRQRVMSAGFYRGCGKGLACPDVGRRVDNPGYFHQMWKQRTVDAVSPRFCVFAAGFLAGLIGDTQQPPMTLDELGDAAATHAARTERRVVYSPFLSATSSESHAGEMPSSIEQQLPPGESRYYSAALDRNVSRAYQPAVVENDEVEIFAQGEV